MFEGGGGQLPNPMSGGDWGFGTGKYGQEIGDMAGGIGGIASGLFNMFGGNQNPYDAASQYYNQIPGMLNNTYNPYIHAGMGALPGMQQYENRGNVAGNNLMNQYSQMTNNPGGLVNKLGASFHQSPGYAFQVQQSLNAANRAAAAGGMAGSPEEQQNIATTTNQLANQDYYNYLNHATQMYGAGIQGMQGTERLGANMVQDLYGAGANASNNLAQNLGSAYMNQGNMAYGSANFNNQMMGGGIGQMLGGIGDIAGLF